ncbi:porin family protein [Algibacter lectus]|uniref:Outer membrane protein with beta-barrel domain n=1 Tax=Algibacter lectus TaxID=221126 RepID=A0A4R8MJ72_9FLAO|nr:porin family protein [Algibacter lectus]MWW23320.1 outer membrane beta-barrel protein [Algibacter lectus]TDY64005.1 outer membrane protein with beta-barrel domain [Algibacter lectus]
MTKTIFQLLLLFAFFNSIAQNSKFELGPEIGLNISDFRYIEARYVQGYSIERISFGLVGKFNFSRNWAIKSKLKYEGKGILNENEWDTGSVIQKLNYLVMPIMAEWRLGKGNLQGFFNFGAYGARLISAKREYYLNSIRGEKDTTDNKDEFKPYDLGLAGGVGIIYQLKNNLKITLDLGGQLGLSPVDSGYRSNTGWRANQHLTGNIGLLFGL